MNASEISSAFKTAFPNVPIKYITSSEYETVKLKAASAHPEDIYFTAISVSNETWQIYLSISKGMLIFDQEHNVNQLFNRLEKAKKEYLERTVRVIKLLSVEE